MASVVAMAACTGSKNNTPSEPVIETLGNNPVTTSQFEYVYKKNNANDADAYTEKSLKDYLALYTNFKLKVTEAKSLGLDTAQSFIKELEGYKKQLAQPYLTEKSVTETLVKEAYERLKEEVSASHILIKVAPDADPADSLKAYNKIKSIRDKAVGGANFEQLAAENSEDPSAVQNKGYLGYFTALQMVYPFEDAAFKTKIGEVSGIVRTKFGYHILKVKDRRASRGEVKVAHIMVRAGEGIALDDSLEAKKKSDEIFIKAKKGDNWDELASQFSDDLGTKNKGGVLPAFGTNAMIPSFEDASFALNTPGEITGPIRTPYGWHIIKLIEKKGLAEFKDLEASLKTKVSKDSRSDLNRSVLIARLKKENQFTENATTQAKVFAKADSTLIKGKFAYSKEDKLINEQLISIGSKKVTVQDFFNYIQEKGRAKANFSPAHYMNLLYKEFSEKTILDYEESNLENKYPDYKNLVSEYREGILLFQLMDTKVWGKALQDTLGLKKFFEANKENYKWNKRLDAIIYNASSKEILTQVKQKLSDGYWNISDPKAEDIVFDLNKAVLTKDDSIRLNGLASLINKDKSLKLKIVGNADMQEAKAQKTNNLSAKRAQLVFDYLKSVKVDEARLSIEDIKLDKSAKNNKVNFVFSSNSNHSLEKIFNEKQALTLQVNHGLYQKGDNAIADAVEWKEGEQVIEKDGRVILVIVKKVEEPRYKNLEEVKGVVISDYQNYLEKEWINELKAKYPVTVNEVELKKLVKK